MESSKIGVVIVLSAFFTFPLIAETLDPPDQYRNAAPFPSTIGLWTKMNISVVEHTAEWTKTHSMIMPSAYCLQQPVEVFKSDIGNCESILRHSLSPIMRILGLNDTQALLDHHEPIVNHKTWGSFLINVTTRAITNPLVENHPNDLQLIIRYKEALNFIMATVFLPLIARYKNFHQRTLWLHCQPSAGRCAMKESLSKKTIDRQVRNSTRNIVLPMVNPEQWLLPMNEEHIISLFNSTIYPELKDKLRYISELFNEGHFVEYLNLSAVEATRFPNSGSFFMYALTQLEGKLRLPSDNERAKAVRDYKTAIITTALSYRLPESYLKSLVTGEIVPAPTSTHYENAPVFPRWLDPMRGMVIRPIMWPLSSSIQLNTGRNNLTVIDVSLPSIRCLQSSSDFVKLPEFCKNATETWRTFMARVYKSDFTSFSSNDEMKNRYPTLISYFTGLDENAKPSTNRRTLMELGTYRLALELALPYINLPLIAHYLKLNTEVVWMTIHSNDSLKPIIGSVRPREIGENTTVLPLVNPRLWHLPLDTQNQYSVLMPNLQPDDPYAIMIEPLRNVLRPGTWFTRTFEHDWNSLRHPTRGILFVHVLYRLSVGMAYSDNDERKSHGASRDLAVIVKNYRTAIHSLASFVHVPPSYIEDEALKAVPLT